jgi:hypothetical protein
VGGRCGKSDMAPMHEAPCCVLGGQERFWKSSEGKGWGFRLASSVRVLSLDPRVVWHRPTRHDSRPAPFTHAWQGA